MSEVTESIAQQIAREFDEYMTRQAEVAGLLRSEDLNFLEELVQSKLKPADPSRTDPVDEPTLPPSVVPRIFDRRERIDRIRGIADELDTLNDWFYHLAYLAEKPESHDSFILVAEAAAELIDSDLSQLRLMLEMLFQTIHHAY